MKVKIETYRKFDIFFDTENEAFSSEAKKEADWLTPAKELKVSKSYAAVKKSIDDFIKENSTFEPFFVRTKPNKHVYNEDKRRIKITGIRKDGRFVAEDLKGKLFQVSEYDESDYILEDDRDEIHFATIAALQAEIDTIRKRIKRAEEAVNGKSLTELKPNYIQ